MVQSIDETYETLSKLRKEILELNKADSPNGYSVGYNEAVWDIIQLIEIELWKKYGIIKYNY